MSKYEDMPVCDLRYLSDVDTIKQIEEISDIALLILPKSKDKEIMNAIAAIPMHDIASTIYLNENDKVQIINGCSEIHDADFDENGNSVIVGNGIIIIENISKETKGSIIVNGMVVIKQSLKNECSLSFPLVNGLKKYMDFNEYKLFGNQIEIDPEFISYLNPKTLIMAGNCLTITSDVTLDMLKEKQILLFAGNKIVCYENIASYVKATAEVGNKIEVLSLGNNE